MSDYSAEVVEIGDQIVALSPTKAGDLVAYLKQTYNIEPAFGPSIKQPEPEKKEEQKQEQTEWSVVLTGCDPKNRVGLIKIYRELSGKGLKDSMDAIVIGTASGLGLLVKEGLSREDAEKLKAQLEAALGTVVLK